MRRFWLKLNRRRHMQQDLAAELEFHREMARNSGNPLPVGRIRDEAYDLWRFTIVEDVLRDAFIGARMLARTPIFTIFSALVLAVGIGANLTAFSLITAIIHPPINVPNPDRFVRIYGTFEHPNTGGDTYLHRNQASSFEDIAGYRCPSIQVVRTVGPNGPRNEMARLCRVTGNLFQTVGVAPELGRLLTPDDARADAPRVVVLSDDGWEHYFGRDPQVVGKTLVIAGGVFKIVGVAPVSFSDVLKVTPEGWSDPVEGTPGPRIFIPYEPRDRMIVTLVGRLKPDVSRPQAEAELTKIALESPETQRSAVHVMRGNTIGDANLWVLLVLLAAIGVTGLAAVLMIACDNIAILLSAKIEVRLQEMGIRLALGANRAHLVRQLVAENLLLSVLGGAGAVIISLLAAWIVERLPWPFPLPDAFHVTFNWQVILFAIVVSFATTLLFGLRPALQAVRKDVVASLNPGGSPDHRRSKVRSTLVVAQITVCTALLIPMLVLVKSQRVSIPPERISAARQVLLASMNFPNAPEKSFEFYSIVILRLVALPQVKSASVAAASPVEGISSGITGSAGAISVQADTGNQAPAQTNIVMGEYFKTIGAAISAGRDFNATDIAGPQSVAIVNDTLAQRVWPRQNPIGHRFKRSDGSNAEVVGLVHDGSADSAGNAVPFVYFPLSQYPYRHGTLIVRSVGPDANALGSLIERTVADMDTQIVVFRMHTIQDEFNLAFLPNRIGMYVAGAPGLLAFLLSIIGTYGTMALLTAQRRREIGIRIALGGHPSSAVVMMLKQGMKWAAAGIALGVLGALGILSMLSREFEGNTHILRFDSSAFSFGVIVLAATAAAACYIPARRASRVNPIEILRSE